MILDEVATFIAANSTLVVGTDLFKAGFPPEAQDTLVTIYETGGAGPAQRFGGTEYESPSLQVIARSTTYPIARTKAQIVWNLLNSTGMTNASLSGTTYVQGRPQQSPFYIGTDERNRPQVSCNYFIDKVVSST